MSREFELKYRADAAAIDAIAQKFGDFTPITMETTYYDTPDLKFSARRWTLRRRMENGQAVCALKIPLPDGSRGEWETACPSLMAGIMQLCAQGAPQELLTLTASGVKPLCGAKFTRLAKTIPLEEGVVELALDQGWLLGGNQELALYEVEVEKKSGSDQAAVAFAQQLQQDFVLSPESKSKQARAMELAAGKKEG